MNPIRRFAAVLAGLAAALVAAALGATAALGSTHPGAPPDSGLAACAYPLSTHDVTAADYRQIRAEFAGSRWPDLRTAGVDALGDLARRRKNRISSAREPAQGHDRRGRPC